MNIFRPQQPYVFRPPKRSPLLGPILHKVSEVFFLRRKFRVRDVAVEGMDRVAALAGDGHSILIAPNHADHADPHVLLRTGRRNGLDIHFMAAREGFEESRLHSFVLQRCGAFSVDREGADIAAIKTAIQMLREGRFPLAIFPEGEIYHRQEQLDPLNEGVATILLRAADKLPDDRNAYLVPTALRFAYDDCVAATFPARLDALERRITWKPRDDMDVVERIYRLGGGLLALKEVEFLGQPQPGTLIERIHGLRNRLVEAIELRHRDQAGTGSIPERVKTLRGGIRKELSDPDVEVSAEREKSLYDDLDTLFVAVQLYSYPGQYLRDEPTVDRIAETILKLEEDVLGDAVYAADRVAHIRLGEPIDVRAFLRDHALKVKTAAGPLTARLRQDIERMLKAGG